MREELYFCVLNMIDPAFELFCSALHSGTGVLYLQTESISISRKKSMIDRYNSRWILADCLLPLVLIGGSKKEEHDERYNSRYILADCLFPLAIIGGFKKEEYDGRYNLRHLLADCFFSLRFSANLY
jgi:hypothetical protein